jgi:hypothetical protein
MKMNPQQNDKYSKGSHMDSDKHLPGFLANRSVADRRNGNACTPPYSTGTGKILIERRSGNDRRGMLHQQHVATEKAGNADMQLD